MSEEYNLNENISPSPSSSKNSSSSEDEGEESPSSEGEDDEQPGLNIETPNEIPPVNASASYGSAEKECKIDTQLYKLIFQEKRNIFLSGIAGTGKSYTIKGVKEISDNLGVISNLTSTTGVSAFSIGGSTIHRFSGIKLGDKPFDVIIKNIYNSRDCVMRWKTCDILVIDEISMLGAKTFELIDKVGKKIRGNKNPFGGLQLIVTGDFFQLPPVNDDFCFESKLWNKLNFEKITLTIPYRFPDLKHFEMLSRIRKGEQTKEDIQKLKSRVKAYKDYVENKKENEEEIKPTKIYSLKKDVEKLNFEELDKLPGSRKIYTCKDKFFPKGNKDAIEQKDYVDYLNTIIPNQVIVKEGAQVMLTYNLNVDEGLVNGSRGVVKECLTDGVKILFKCKKESVKIGYNAYSYEDEKVKICRSQIPLILSWANTVHKSQGATLDYCILDLGTSIFSAGMAYVALSRVRTLEGILLSNFMPDRLIVNKKVLKFEEDSLPAIKGEGDESPKEDGKEKDVYL